MTQFEQTIDKLIAETKAETLPAHAHVYGKSSRCEASTWIDGTPYCTKKHRYHTLEAEAPAAKIDPLIEAVVDLEVAEDEYHARSFSEFLQMRDHGFGFGSPSRVEVRRWVEQAENAVADAGGRVGEAANAAWTEEADFAAFGRWLVQR